MKQSTAATRNLLYNLVRRDLTVRYKSTVLGFFWSFVKPLILTLIFYVAFQKILKISFYEEGIPPALHMLTGILAWTFFAGATSESMNVIFANANLIKKVRLPLGVFPLAAVCSHLIHFLLALLVLLVLLIFFVGAPTPAFLCVPLIMALQFLLVLAVSLALAALNVFYRDVASLWEVLMTAWFYATPVVYPVGMVMKRLEEGNLFWLKWLYLLNPMTPIVLAYQQVLLYAPLDKPISGLDPGDMWISLGACVGLTLVLLTLAWKLFARFSKSFADEL